MSGSTVRRLALLAVVATAVTSCAGAGVPRDLVGIATTTWEKREAVAKTAKALRKGFDDLTPEEEYYLGRAVAARILQRYPPSGDVARVRYLNLVGNAVARHSRMPTTFRGYRFMLLESQDVNAFAAPGGFIFVTSGLYGRLADEDQLAGVLSHEVAHVALRHGLAAIRSANLTQAFAIIGTEAVKEFSPAQVGQLTEAFEGSINDIANQLVVSGYSRSQELDADAEAIWTAYRAGYDPGAMAEFLAALADSPGPARGGWDRSHPGTAERVLAAQRFLASERLAGERDPVRTARFTKFALP